MDFFLAGDNLPHDQRDPGHRPSGPAQGALFAMYDDRQRKPADRYNEPTLMDYLADHPKK